MKKHLTYKIASASLIAVFFVSGLLFSTTIQAQQNIIADKDNTHPELSRALSSPAYVTSFSAKRENGYNEVMWTALREEEIRKYIVEYSTNGVDFQSAGELLVNSNNKSMYSLKHYTTDNRVVVYRIKSENLNSRFFYSDDILLDGAVVPPVRIYPTIITGNTVNVNAAVAVERITIVSGAGVQVFAKDINGQMDYIPVVIPSLGKGMYWMTFYGRGWKTTTKFIVA